MRRAWNPTSTWTVIAAFALVTASRATADWNLDGNPVCTVAGDQGPFVTAIQVGSGPGYNYQALAVMWVDHRPSASGSDLYLGSLSQSDVLPADGQRVCDAPGDQLAPALTAVTQLPPSSQYYNDQLIAAWEDHRDAPTNGADVYGQRFGGTSWGANGTPICAAPGDQGAPRIVRDDQGALVVWVDRRSGGADLYGQRLTAYGNPRWTPGGIPLCSAAGDQDSVALGTAGEPDSSVVLAWRDTRPGAPGIYVLRILADGTPAPGWPADGVRVTPDVTAPRLIVEPSGALFVLWDHVRANGEREPRVVRLGIDGTLSAGWPAQGAALCDAAGDRALADAVLRGPGSIFACWSEDRGGGADVYLQRIDDGAIPLGWSPDGRVACSASGAQTEPSLVAQTDGAVIVAWRDARGADSDIYALRLRADGAVSVGWVADGTRLTGASGDQRGPRAVLHDVSQNGARVVWLDERDVANDGIDLYGQIVTERGRVDVPVPSTAGRALNLGPARPTPSRGTVALALDCAAPGGVRLDVVDLAGRGVRVLGRRSCGAGTTVRWDGRNDRGQPVAPGVYFVRAISATGSVSRRVVLAR